MYKLRNFTGAILYADKALDIDPVNTNALIVKGFALGISGNHTEAIKYFNQALENDPENIDALYGKRLILNESSNHTEVMNILSRSQ